MFDPDTSQAITPISSQQQPQQHLEQQKQHVREHQPDKPQRLPHRVSSPVMHRQTKKQNPVILTSHSMDSLPVSSNPDVSITAQFREQLLSHRRQKSESPLPEVPSDPELPTFTPQRPAQPGSRAPKHPPKSSTLPQSVLKHSCSALGTPSRISLPSHHYSPLSLHRMKNVLSVTEASLSSEEPDLQHQAQVPREEDTTEVVSHSCSPDSTEPMQGDETYDAEHRSESEPSVQLASSSEKLFTLTPLNELINECVPPPSDVALLHTAVTLDPEPDPCVPLSSVELATLSLNVLDILPQLAAYLGIDYSEYECIIADEPSPQRQSMAVGSDKIFAFFW